MATWRNIHIAVWATQGTGPLASKVEETGRALIAAHPEGVSSIHVVIENTPLPDADGRTRFDQITSRYADDLACILTVIEGDGFWRSAMHSFVTGLYGFARRPFKARSSSSIQEGVRLLTRPHRERTGVRVEAEELERSLRWVRERL